MPGVEISSVMPQPVYFPNPALTATSHGPMSADTGLPVALALPLAQSVVPPSAHVPETYKVVPVLCSWAKRYHIVDGHGETYADATGLALWCAGDIVTLRSSRDGTALMRIHRHACAFGPSFTFVYVVLRCVARADRPAALPCVQRPCLEQASGLADAAHLCLLRFYSRFDPGRAAQAVCNQRAVQLRRAPRGRRRVRGEDAAAARDVVLRVQDV